MNRQKLRQIFEDEGVSSSRYVLANWHVRDEVGFRCFFSDFYNSWVTELVERNNVRKRYKFEDESSACRKLLEFMAVDFPRLKKYL